MRERIQCFFLTPTDRHRDGLPLYSRSDGRPDCTISEAEPGAMWDAPWMIHDSELFGGDDGRCLVVKLPDGSMWVIDGPSYNANRSQQSQRGWQRTGVPPRITARPSILIHGTGYHAFLTDGVLEPC